MLEPLSKTKLYEEIVRQLMDKIKSGQLKPGDKLPTERELTLQCNVSRAAIREALSALEMMGITESKAGSGTYIKAMTLDNLLDSFAGLITKNDRLIMDTLQVRFILETEIARLAARKATPQDIAALEKTLSNMEQEIAHGQIGLVGDNEFHTQLAVIADNLAMVSILGLCGELLSSTRQAALKALGDPSVAMRHHRAILDAIKNKDETKAALLMQEHLQKAYHNVEKQLLHIS